METKKVVEDLLLSSKNEDWMRKVLISSHVISDKFLDLYELENRNYFAGDQYNIPELSMGIMSHPDIVTIIDTIISVYVIGENSVRGTKKVLTITGNDSVLRSISLSQMKKEVLRKSKDFSFLQEGEFKILYFPFCEKEENSPENYEFYYFREISKNRFLINSLSRNINNPNLNIREGFSRKDVVNMVLESIYDSE